MQWSIQLNESVLNVSSVWPSYGTTEKYVTIQSCKDYIAVTQFWNIAYEIMIGILIIILFIALYKLGKLDAEKLFFKKLGEDDTDGTGNADVDSYGNDSTDDDSDDQHGKHYKDGGAAGEHRRGNS